MMTKTNISCPSSLLDASASAIMPQPEDDVALMRQVIAQDHEAFNVLYARYAQRLRGYLIRFLGQSGLVDEVLNDVMLVMWQRASRFDFTAQLLPWLLGIARQKARKALARNSPIVAPSARCDENDIDTPEETILRQEHHENIAHALNTLSPCHRTVLDLLVRQGCSYQEIAKRTNTPVNTVKTQVFRARRSLANRIAALEHGFFPSSPSPERIRWRHAS